ncbi:MAG: polyprenyl synthetase family protein [Planctomycetes bacterium]|nr:polyprenyl synthetase family protein [Planctomycetota bacterium]
MWLEARRAAVDAAIAEHAKSLKTDAWANTRLPAAVQYSLCQPGKRLRPILVLETCQACGGTDDAAWPAAIAVECIHAFSLIHDDLPAMDDDDLRRGMPTNHKVFGEAIAILAGDWLSAHAFSLLARLGLSAERNRAAIGSLAAATCGMIVGQAADIEGEGQPTDADRVRLIHAHKTAALIEGSCVLGALAAQASDEILASVRRYGRHLGLAFQIADDLLDATATTQELGKRAGKDAAASKQTYPAAFGLEESKRQAQKEIDHAMAALAPIGGRASHLRELAQFVISREK